MVLGYRQHVVMQYTSTCINVAVEKVEDQIAMFIDLMPSFKQVFLSVFGLLMPSTDLYTMNAVKDITPQPNLGK